MPTAGIVSGSKMRLSVEGAVVARATNCTFSLDNELRETSHKDQVGDFKTYEYGEFAIEMSSDFLVEETAGGLATLSTKLLDKEEVGFIFGTGQPGDLKYSGSAKIKSLKVDAAVKENAKASISLVGYALVQGTFA